MRVGDIAPQIALVVGAVTVLLVALVVPRRLQWVGAPVAGLALAVSGVLTVVVPLQAGQRLTMDGLWALDGTTTAAGLLIILTTALTIGPSPEWLGDDPRHGEFYAVLLLSAVGAIAMAGAADTLQLAVGMLLSSVTGYTLAAYHRRSPLSVEAGIKYFLVGAFANTLFVLGVTLAFGLAATTLYEPASAALTTADGTVLALATGLLGLGLAFKLGAVPAHQWVPDVAQGAPAPAAAFLTVAPKIGAAVALARLLPTLPEDLVGWRPVAAALAAGTMTLGNLAALAQDDLRRLLGWSSVSQSGYAIMAVVALERADLAIPALITFLLAYALANLAAFGVVTELRGRTALADYGGMATDHPWLAGALVISFLSLVGVPPLIGFTGKLTLFTATIDAGYTWLAIVAIANTVVSLAYYLRVLGPMYFDPTPRISPAPLLGRWAAAATALAALLVVATGIGAEPIVAALDNALLLP
ncbi:NADH-quinone oxidoreductase subunit N [soil metagenome]